MPLAFASMEERQWKQAAADIQDGINCNTGLGECKDGIPAEKKMKLVKLSAADQGQAKAMVQRVLKGWASRCGAECVADWNKKVGSILGVEAPMP